MPEHSMKPRLFQVVASVVGIYHVVLGLAALVLPAGQMSSTVELILGFSPSITDQFVLIAKFTGVYVLAFGLVVLLVARDAEKYKLFITPVLLLFAIRLLNKVILFDDIGAQLDVPPARNVLAVAFVAIFFFGMLFTAPAKFYRVDG